MEENASSTLAVHGPHCVESSGTWIYNILRKWNKNGSLIIWIHLIFQKMSSVFKFKMKPLFYEVRMQSWDHGISIITDAKNDMLVKYVQLGNILCANILKGVLRNFQYTGDISQTYSFICHMSIANKFQEYSGLSYDNVRNCFAKYSLSCSGIRYTHTLLDTK